MANALAAIGAARHIGVKPSIACEALNGFKGVKRRMELIYDSANLYVYEDFAHHPTAITSTLDGLRNKVGAENILAIVEPGSHTMRNGTHADTLKAAVSQAQQVIWYRPARARWDMAAKLAGPSVAITDSITEIV